MQLDPLSRALRSLLFVCFVYGSPTFGQALTNGGNHDGAISANQSNLWTFVANAGDRLVLRDGRLTGAGFNPWTRLYGPDGALVFDSGAANSQVAQEIGRAHV